MKKLNESILSNLKEAVDNGQVDIINYGDLETYSTRKEAMDFYLNCMACSEGAEQERYATIVSYLNDGDKVAFDNWDDTEDTAVIHRVNGIKLDKPMTYSEYKKNKETLSKLDKKAINKKNMNEALEPEDRFDNKELYDLIKNLPDEVEYKGKKYQAFNVMDFGTESGSSLVYYCNMDNTPSGDPQESNDYFVVNAKLNLLPNGKDFKGVKEINYIEDLTEGVKLKKKRKLTEAPEDEKEYEINDEEIETTEEVPEEDNTEELDTKEVKDETVEDEEETVDQDEEQPFYAKQEEFDELRDRLVPLDYRLFLVNGEIVCIGRLNGADVEVLTSNRPEGTNAIPSESNEKADEIEAEAKEDNEDAYEYKWIKRPSEFRNFLQQVNVLYLSPDIEDEDKEQYAGLEANHESVLNFLDKEMEDNNIKPSEDEVEETETEEDMEETEVGEDTYE